MKFGYACTFAGKPRGGTPAPRFKKRTPVLPSLPACRALSRQIGKCIFRPMLAVFRTGRGHQLAFGGHVLSPGLPHLAAQQIRHNRRLSYPPPSHEACLEIYWAAPIARCAPPCLRAPDWAVSPHWACFCLLGASEIGSDITGGGIRPIATFGVDYRQGKHSYLRYHKTRMRRRHGQTETPSARGLEHTLFLQNPLFLSGAPIENLHPSVQYPLLSVCN
jgi:hypothetical protein